jgi:hypothetical protein
MADVYNLTIRGEHEYFADNILVSNCHDALRYALMTRPAPSIEPDDEMFDDRMKKIVGRIKQGAKKLWGIHG